MLPDEEFVLDRHPSWTNIVIGAGFSGRFNNNNISDWWMVAYLQKRYKYTVVYVQYVLTSLGDVKSFKLFTIYFPIQEK